MTAKKGLWLILGALMFSVFIFLGAFLYVKAQLDTTAVFVASNRIEARHKMTEEDLKQVEISSHLLTESMILNMEDVVGKYMVIDGFASSGAILFDEMFESIDESLDAPTLRLKEGQAIYALDVSLKMSAGNSYVVNQKVDLYGTIDTREYTLSDRLISSVRIVGLKDKNGLDVETNTKSIPKIMLLAIDQSQISTLAKLEVLGEINIASIAYSSDSTESLANVESELWRKLNAQ